jgi:DNA-binding NtrC family response regulator
MTRPKLILVVDDDSLIRLLFSRAAEAFHVVVDYAPSAQEARIFLEKKTYDYVFLDMKLENGVSGMEVLQYINTGAPSVNVVIMSGSVNLHDLMEEANQVGVLSFIKKPTQFTKQYLVSVFTKLGLRPAEKPGDKAQRPPEAQEP